MDKRMSATKQVDLTRLRELSARTGSDPLLTQASTGNISMKRDGILWIKASGKWMADATREDILIPLDLAQIKECVSQRVDPAELHAHASIETAMHAVLPHRVVLHVHSVNTIAWAVRHDAQIQLEHRLGGLRWQWISYVPSGLPLAQGVEKVSSASADADVFVLGNHGLVIGGDNCDAVEDLLWRVEQRLAICPRPVDAIDYPQLGKIADRSSWGLPDAAEVHAFGTDAISRAVLSGGLLHPCQSIFSNLTTPELFRSVPYPDPSHQWESRYCTRPFLIIEGCGVIVRRDMTRSQRAIMTGLAQVVQRIGPSARLRYLTDPRVKRVEISCT